ncbi:hypothetical protein B0H14DRAFT_2865578 [Mycena olivaceomarginata]|nr:hypothetical protein B0H14DRAFT_2865578 [Mycena olivaceomarginata]
MRRFSRPKRTPMDSSCGISPVPLHLARKPRSPSRPPTRILIDPYRLRAPRRPSHIGHHTKPENAAHLQDSRQYGHETHTVVIHRLVKRTNPNKKVAPSPAPSRFSKKPRSPPQLQSHRLSNFLRAPRAHQKLQHSGAGYSAAQNSKTIHLMPLRVDSGGESAGDDDSELAALNKGRPDPPPPWNRHRL